MAKTPGNIHEVLALAAQNIGEASSGKTATSHVHAVARSITTTTNVINCIGRYHRYRGEPPFIDFMYQPTRTGKRQATKP